MIRDLYHKPFPILNIDDTLYLREQSIEDTEAFFEYYADPEVSQYILAGTPKTPSEAQHEIHYCRNLFYQRSGIYWTIARKSDDRMIGAIGLYINNAHNRAEICYDLHKSHWRQGIMSKALKVVIRFAFKKIKLCRIEAVTVKKNHASIEFLKKLDFLYEGTLRQYRQYNGSAHDIEMFAMTRKSIKR